jgi:2'-5' RNA ligase
VTDAKTNKRLFFALWPSEKQRRRIHSALEPHRAGLSGKWTARDNWHVTLVFVGSFPERDIPALQAAASKVRCPPFTLRFERIDYWAGPKIMCLEAGLLPDQLAGLVRSLESAASAFGYQSEKRPYRPHMTIARRAKFFNPITLAQPVELQWSGFALIESLSMPGGVRYRPLKQ